MGDKLEKHVQNLKDGLKDVAEKFTAEDNEPRTDAMAGRISGARHVAHRERTKDELYAEARSLDVKGRSTMTKSELEKAIHAARRTH
jgi:3-mercaptopyruvate sulfurtransferase SseA